MKLTLTLLLFAVFAATAGSTYSQNVRIDLKMQDATLVDVFREIERTSEFGFFFKSEELNLDQRVSIELKNASIEDILKKVLSDRYEYRILDKNIVITRGKFTTTEQQQGKSVSGKVTDSSGSPLPGVSVVVKGTTTGIITDANGNYSLSNVPENATLQFSFVGMKGLDVVVGGKTTVNVKMEEETIGIDEVVAVGYGTQRKKDLTGSVTTVSTEDFEKVPATSPLQALQGRASGLQITTTSGLPGASANVMIRGVQSINGSTSPIYVVDGVITDGINNLNLNSIESISVLKDASASAIYGARAANGVILVTTKRGQGDKAPEITLNTYFGVQTESNLKVKLLNASQFLELWTESYQNAKLDLPWNTSQLAYYNGVDTKWKDLLTQTGIIQNYDLSVSGGSEKSNYYISASYLNQKGMVIETGFDKYTFSLNTDHKINTWIKFGNSLNVYSTKTEGDGNAYSLALSKVPITRAFEENGDYGKIVNTSLEHMNVNPLWYAKNNLNKLGAKGLRGSLYLTLDLMKGLDFTARGSMDYSTNYNTAFSSGVSPHYGWEGTNKNTIYKEHNETIHWISDFLLNYKTTIKEKHEIKALLGYSLEESSYENLWGRRTGTPNDEIRFLNAGDPLSMQNGNGFSDWAFASMFGRLNYTFDNKYLFTATIRRDGTSRLTQDKRIGFFPSASLAWRISKESFLKDVDFIDDLKIRASVGSLGNVLSIGNYATISSLTPKLAVLNQGGALGYTLSTPVNGNLKWESAIKKNIGIDASLMNNTIYSTIEYFIEDTYNLLFSNPIPVSTGLSGSPLINAGQIRNKGYEFEIGYRKQKGVLSYDMNFNLSHVKNSVIDLEGRDLRTSGLVEGYPVNSYFGYKSSGIIYNESELALYTGGTFKSKTVGDIGLIDNNGYDAVGKLTGVPDGKVDAADRTIIGNKYPDLVYGAMGTVNYKNWGFQILLQGIYGIDLNYGPNSPTDLISLMASWARNEDARILDRYNATKNPTGTWPRLSKNDSGSNTTFSDFWLEDASYIRINNMNVNYNLPKRVCDKFGISRLGLYVSVQNAYTFTKFKGPEVETTVDPLTGVPQPRTWTIGLKATL